MKRYISTIIPCLLIVASMLPASAQRLPSMTELPWIGYFSGYERRDFQFGITYTGQFELYLMANRKQRTSSLKTVKIYPEVMIVTDEGKRIFRSMKKDEGFETTLKPGLDHEKVTYTTEAGGDAKVEITVEYDGDRIILDGRLLDRGSLKTGKLFFGFKVLMPKFYSAVTYGKDKDKDKEQMRRDKFRFIRADNGNRESLKVYEPYSLSSPELGGGLITELEVKMDPQEGRTFVFTTLNGKGKFQLDNRVAGENSEPWRGYVVKWYRPMTEEKGKEIKPFVIEVK